MSYIPITYVRMQRVTAQQMNYIQTQYRNCEKLKVVDSLPLVVDSEEGEILYLSTDDKIYQFNGTSWETVGDVKLPISDEDVLLKNEDNPSKKARFDLSLISDGTTRIYYLPDEEGTFALVSQTPVIVGDTERAILYRGETNTDIRSNSNILIGSEIDENYIEINKNNAINSDVDIIRYNESYNNPVFRVEQDGKVVAKRLCLFSGASG